MQKKLTPKGVWNLLKQTFTSFSDDRIVKLSAALAYYTVFSIGPMIIVVIYVAGLVYGREAIQGNVFHQLQGLVGADAAGQIQEMIKNAALNGSGPIAAAIGIATLLIGATSVFAEIQDSINMIWGLKPKPKKGWLKMILNRLLSFSIIVSLGFVLLVSLVVNGVIEALMDRLQARYPNVTVVVLYIINLVITFSVITALFSVIFKVLPDALIKWKDVMIGSMVTALLFMIGKFAITFYIGKSNVGSTYGAAGSLVVLLLWVYYSAIILYFGAEFTKAYATDYGSFIRPSPYAVWVKNVEVEEGRTSLKQQEQKKKDENESTGDNIKVT
ncbi:YihY/virulence factor BrkB family protein [Flavisolibacter nicotianae]|uniref:YihY/virulence factor BrkB family protein n=1 Tax=Flavisolibacter nicotianae TaxID=2364882 RepID=UPI000EB45C2A|nr:YihY/virulence factor BrkB family protein [Flavisolibacter nicotianae]